MLDDMERLAADRIIKVRYETLIARPEAELKRVCVESGIAEINNLQELPLSKHTLTKPDPDKWKRHAAAIEDVWPLVAEQAARAAKFIADTE